MSSPNGFANGLGNGRKADDKAIGVKLLRYRPGPGMMVSAAFIGPGTVTACTLAGANFGFALVWALVFATITTIILQSFAIRIAMVTNMGLAEAIMASLPSRQVKMAGGALLILALAVGNAAYEAGNITGALLGLEAINGTLPANRLLLICLIALTAALVILLSQPRWVERILILMVVVMSLAFLATVLMVRPDLSAMLAGLIPTVPERGLFTAIALIGTTIVPYNLFLHAASARQRWAGPDGLEEAQVDNAVSIGLGGLVSIAILATAASSFFGSATEITNALDMAKQLNPLFGNMAATMLGLGLFAAGLTSAITAPLATGYILQEIFDPNGGTSRGIAFKAGVLTVLLFGTGVALLNYQPIEIIFVAQIANGLLLPIVAFFLLRLAANRELLGERANGTVANLAGAVILLIATLLGARLVARALGWWP